MVDAVSAVWLVSLKTPFAVNQNDGLAYVGNYMVWVIHFLLKDSLHLKGLRKHK